MIDGYLTDIITSDDWPTRQIKTQRWMKKVAESFASVYSTGVPMTGGYLINLQSGDTRPTINCALVAWAKSISNQTP